MRYFEKIFQRKKNILQSLMLLHISILNKLKFSHCDDILLAVNSENNSATHDYYNAFKAKKPS